MASFRTVTDRGDSIRTLFIVLLVLSGAVLLLVWVWLALNLLRYRERPGDDPAVEPRQKHGNTKLEIGWTSAAVALVAAIFIYALVTMLHVQASSPNALRVDVIGHDWWWEYRYPAQGITTANQLRLPVGVPIELHITADDVIHSFWVPQLGWKQDAIPGHENVLRFTLQRSGDFAGACSEYCGAEHAWMLIFVRGDEQAAFESWVATQQASAPSPSTALAQRGQQLFVSNTCVSCHAITGTSAKGQVGPNLSNLGQRPYLGAGVLPNTPENLARFINHVQEVKPGAHMPSYRFSDEELQALVAYLEGLK